MPAKKKKVMRAPKTSGPIDVYLGEKIKEARRQLGLSQTELGSSVGITFQQVQKYESGRNRMTVARVLQFCRTLKIDVAELLSGVPKDLR